MDFEEELEAHCIRKEAFCENTNRNGKRSGKTNKFKILDYIPTILKHLSILKENCWQENLVSTLSGRVHFKCCLVYGTILAKINEKDTRHSYMLDDGTSCLEISVFRKDQELNAVSKLEKELSAIMHVSEKGITANLKNILLATRKQLDDCGIKAGTKVLAYGKPVYYRNQVSLNVYHILEDNTPDRSIEIAFKDELVACYKNYI